MKILHGFSTDNLLGDAYGGVTAAVVALPLALAFGVASGAGPVAGIYGAIFVGFFAALFGGTPAQVSGPTGPMTVVMAAVLTQYGQNPAMAFTIVAMGGCVQILFGACRLGSYIRLIPYTVISGFMTGIGCIIIIIELAPLAGHPTASGGPVGALMQLPVVLQDYNIHAIVVGCVALAICMFTPFVLARRFPPPLIALIVGTLLAHYLLTDAPVIGTIPQGLPTPQIPTFSMGALPDMVQSALILGLLGSIDSLLTSLVADSVTRTQHDSNRELVGQGIGNIIAGLFGAIPGAGATMRTVVNIRAGGRTSYSGILHAIVLLTLMLGLAPLAELIPHAVLAGILLKVGYDIVDWRFIRRMHRAPASGVIIMLTVLLLTVFVDLVTAVGVGVVMASLLFVKKMHDLQVEGLELVADSASRHRLADDEAAILKQTGDRILLYRLHGPASFGAAKDLTARITDLEHHEVLVLDFTDVPLVDTSAVLAIEDVIGDAHSLGRRVFLCGASQDVGSVLEKLLVPDVLSKDDMPDSRHAALKRAQQSLAAKSKN